MIITHGRSGEGARQYKQVSRRSMEGLGRWSAQAVASTVHGETGQVVGGNWAFFSLNPKHIESNCQINRLPSSSCQLTAVLP